MDKDPWKTKDTYQRLKRLPNTSHKSFQRVCQGHAVLDPYIKKRFNCYDVQKVTQKKKIITYGKGLITLLGVLSFLTQT